VSRTSEIKKIMDERGCDSEYAARIFEEDNKIKVGLEVAQRVLDSPGAYFTGTEKTLAKGLLALDKKKDITVVERFVHHLTHYAEDAFLSGHSSLADKLVDAVAWAKARMFEEYKDETNP